MKMRNYIKEKKKTALLKCCFTQIKDSLKSYFLSHRKEFACAVVVIAIVPLLSCVFLHKSVRESDISESTLVKYTGMPVMAATSQRSVISIPAGVVKAHPFVPYREIVKNKNAKANDVPSFTLVEPPEMVNENSDAARVMDTIVSGILYDKYSPSAILNIEGNDYLVKKGDVVNNYKVVSIMRDSVTVQLGSNVYKAGIGEILTEGNLNHNDVSNLKNKFGGEKR